MPIVNQEKCNQCGLCVSVCTCGAIVTIENKITIIGNRRLSLVYQLWSRVSDRCPYLLFWNRYWRRVVSRSFQILFPPCKFFYLSSEMRPLSQWDYCHIHYLAFSLKILLRNEWMMSKGGGLNVTLEIKGLRPLWWRPLYWTAILMAGFEQCLQCSHRRELRSIRNSLSGWC